MTASWFSNTPDTAGIHTQRIRRARRFFTKILGDAQKLVHDYQHRPAEELYDCDADPWNRNNLAKDSKHAETLTARTPALPRSTAGIRKQR